MRVLILTENLVQPPFVKNMLEPLANDPDLKLVACLYHPVPEKGLIAKLKAHRQRGRRGYLLVLAFQALANRLKRPSGSNKHAFALRDWLSEKEIPLIPVSSLSAPPASEAIAKAKAGLAVLAGYHRLVKGDFIRLFPQGVLSYHYGDLRKFRGQPAGFWELYKGENELVVTVQKIREGIDNGIPLAEKVYPITMGDNLRTLGRKVEATAAPLMHQAIRMLLTPGYTGKFPEQYGKVYTLPRLWQWMWFQLKMLIRQILSKISG
jgi:hypothetical protein